MSFTQNDYYRKQLSDTAGKVYDHLLSNIHKLAFESGITVSRSFKATPEDMYKAYFALRNDRPEYYFLDRQLHLEGYLLGYIKATSPRRFSREQIFRINRLLRREVADILEKTCHNNVYIREGRIYEEIAKRYKYKDGLYAHDLSGPVVFKQAVCEGLSKLLVLVLREAGIPAIEVRGLMKGQGHSWAAAYINGHKYYLDVTQDLECNSFTGMGKRYFNLSEQEILRDHTICNLAEEKKCLILHS